MRETVTESNTLQLAIEITQNELPIENEQIHPGVIYDTSLENTLNNIENGPFCRKKLKRDNGDIDWNGFPVEKMGGNKPKINERIYVITPGIQKILTDTSNVPLKSSNDKDNEKFIKFSENLDFGNLKAIPGECKSNRYMHSKTNSEKRVNKSNLEGQVIKINIPYNIIDIYTRLEVLLGLKISGYTDTLTEASSLIDEIYKRKEIQNEQQYRNALSKNHTKKMDPNS